jgi:hypothetical protein
MTTGRIARKVPEIAAWHYQRKTSNKAKERNKNDEPLFFASVSSLVFFFGLVQRHERS